MNTGYEFLQETQFFQWPLQGTNLAYMEQLKEPSGFRTKPVPNPRHPCSKPPLSGRPCSKPTSFWPSQEREREAIEAGILAQSQFGWRDGGDHGGGGNRRPDSMARYRDTGTSLTLIGYRDTGTSLTLNRATMDDFESVGRGVDL